MRRLPALAVLFLVSCARVPHGPVDASAPNNAPRAIAVYRTVAESIYVSTTKRVVAVATTSLDSACTAVTCADLAARWGVETLWWARGDSSEARDARADLLARAAPPFDVRAVTTGQAMLLEADAGDVPSEGATVDEIGSAMGWQRHTVRGLFSGTLKKKLGLTLASAQEERGRVYRITEPAGA